MLRPFRFVLALAVLAAGCAATAPVHRSASLSITNSGGDAARLEVSGEAVDSVVHALLDRNLGCGGELDAQLGRVLATLDRRGRSAHASVTGNDGRLEGRRHGDSFDLAFVSTGGGRLELTAPWGVAQCLLGRRVSLSAALSGHRHPTASIRIRSGSADQTTVTVGLD
jgi:hypothetical protein